MPPRLDYADSIVRLPRAQADVGKYPNGWRALWLAEVQRDDDDRPNPVIELRIHRRLPRKRRERDVRHIAREDGRLARGIARKVNIHQLALGQRRWLGFAKDGSYPREHASCMI